MPKTTTTPTLAEFAPQYITMMSGVLKPETLRSYQQRIRSRLLPAFGALHLSGITKGPVTSWWLSNQLTVQHQQSFMTLRSIMALAVDLHLLPSWNVRIKGYAKKLSPKRPTFTADQALAVLSHLDPYYAPALTIGLSAGMRIGEICGLQHGDWDPDSGLLTIERQWSRNIEGPTKNNETGDVAPFTFALPYLEKLTSNPPKWRTSGDPLFRGKHGARMSSEILRVAWNDARRWEKLNNFNVHDLRHVSISAMARATGDLKQTQAFARHRDPASTLRYMHALEGAEVKKANSAKASLEFGA